MYKMFKSLFKTTVATTHYMMYGTDKGTAKTAFYDLVDKSMAGKEVLMSAFKGDVLCVVNVASK